MTIEDFSSAHTDEYTISYWYWEEAWRLALPTKEDPKTFEWVGQRFATKEDAFAAVMGR